MKTTILIVLVAVVLCLSVASMYSAAAGRPPTNFPQINSQRVDLKVLKVFSAQDGEHVYRAYLVEWNGQEVVVDDVLAKTKYRTDDTITVSVGKFPYPQGKESYGLLHFGLRPPAPSRRR